MGQSDVYFWNDSYFNKILNVALLSTWLSLKPLCLAQLCIYIWGYQQTKNYASINNIPKIMNF